MPDITLSKINFVKIQDDEQDNECDFCAHAGQEEPAYWETEFAVEGVGSNLFRQPRPVRLCHDCFAELPRKRSIKCHWDTQGTTEGWYCVLEEDDKYIDDSMKGWFPVVVDEFGKNDSDKLHAELAREFPYCEIEIKDPQ